MVECPVCGAVSQGAETACAVCGLPYEFIQVIQEGSDPPPAPPPVLTDGEPASAPETAPPGPSRPTPADFIWNPSGNTTKSEPAQAEEQTPDLSFVAPDRSPRGPVEEALRVGHELGLDLSGSEHALEQAKSEGKSSQVSRLRREVVRRVLDGLMDRYRALCDRRNALPLAVRTQSLDAELTAYRKALSGGELALAEARRVNAQGAIEAIEAAWNRIKTRITEAGEMIRALREMGGVAPAVLRPVVDAVRIPHRGEAGQIEGRLKKANDLLWGLLVPRMDFEISKGRSLLNETTAPPARTNLIRREIDRMVEEIRSQKIDKALESRRFLRLELASIKPPPARSTVRRSFIE